jgi:spore coat polysaccharide biosynthesis protein SpsF
MLGCIIQARMGSTRLPGKVMEILDGKNPSIFYTINQLRSCKLIDKIIVATTTNSEDDVIENFVTSLGVDVFRGESDNVLSRYYYCAKKYSLSSILRVTADCPLIDPLIVDKGISLFLQNDYDYVTNTFPRTFPDGNETEIFSFKSLQIAYDNAILPSEQEHVTPYFRNNKNKFSILNFTHDVDISNLRWTLDYEVDLKLIKTIIMKIQKRPIHLSHILSILSDNPSLIEINKNHAPNEGYQKSLKQDKEFLKNLKPNKNK